MQDFLDNLNSEYRTFNLNKINIEDEGMEDLEKFNLFLKLIILNVLFMNQPKKFLIIPKLIMLMMKQK